MAGRRPASLDDLLARCTFPPAGTAVTLRVLRRRRLDGAGRPRRRRRAATSRRPRRPRPAPDVGRRGRPGRPTSPPRLGVPFERRTRRRRAGPQPRGAGPRRPAAAPARRTRSPATPPTTRPRRCSSTCCAAPGPSGLAAMRPGPDQAAPRPAPRRDAWRCAPTVGLDPVDDPTNADRRFVRNRVRHELLPLLADIAGRDVVPLLVRTADVLRDDDRPARRARRRRSTRPTPGPLAAAEPAARPPGPAALARRRTATRRTRPPSTGCSPSPAARATACELAGGRRVERHRQRLRIVDADPEQRRRQGSSLGQTVWAVRGMSRDARRRRPADDGHPAARPVGARHHAAPLHLDPQGQAGDLRAARRLRRQPPPGAPPGGDHLDPRERVRLRDLDHPGAAQPAQLRRARRHRPGTARSTATTSTPWLQGVLPRAPRAAARPAPR